MLARTHVTDWLAGTSRTGRLIIAFALTCADTIHGGSGADTFNMGTAADGTDSFTGGAGTDAADYSGRSNDMTIALDGTATSGEALENDTLGTDIENANGGGGIDTITGN